MEDYFYEALNPSPKKAKYSLEAFLQITSVCYSHDYLLLGSIIQTFEQLRSLLNLCVTLSRKNKTKDWALVKTAVLVLKIKVWLCNLIWHFLTWPYQQLHSVIFEQLWGHAVHSGWVQKLRGWALPKRDRQDGSKSKIDKIHFKKAKIRLNSRRYSK